MASRSTDSTPKQPDWVPKWLKVYRDTGVVRLACHAVGIDRSTPYHLKDRDPEFKRLWEEAEEDAADILEAEARNRARKGSDTLMIFLLKNIRPQKFRETVRNEQVGADDAPPIRHSVSLKINDARNRPDDL